MISTSTHKTRKGAATYVNVTVEDIEAFLRRAFRAYKPLKRGVFKNEVFIAMPIDNWARIEVMTAVSAQAVSGRGVGEDAIRITLLGPKGPLHRAKFFTRVHRTQNWRDNLRERIETALEYYEDKITEWRVNRGPQQGGGTP